MFMQVSMGEQVTLIVKINVLLSAIALHNFLQRDTHTLQSESLTLRSTIREQRRFPLSYLQLKNHLVINLEDVSFTLSKNRYDL